MRLPLLATKLQIPRLPAGWVSRTRLLGQLRPGRERPLTLVSAPAGFGKTSLVAEWARQPGRAAWLTLDEADNDPARFLAYLVAALQSLDPDLGRNLLAALQLPQPPALATLLPVLVNELAERTDSLLLVLDDCHLLEAQPVLDALIFLVNNPPAPLHLVLTTRADPPLPLARLRARGQLVEVRQADLRFTVDEVLELLRREGVLDLSPAAAAALAARTEGWAVGLQLAAASLRGQSDPAAFIREFSGANRHILDFLGEEVLQRQPPEVQAFLLKTSILERLNGALCDAVLEQPAAAPAAQILQELEHANLFITPLDDRREWYRYHHLFGDLLQHRLQQTEPDLVSVLHGRASRWFDEHSDPDAAIRHALAARELTRAADLIEMAAPLAWRQGQVVTLRSWMDALPAEVGQARPLLCLYRALALLMRLRDFDRLEATIEAAAVADSIGRFRGEVDLLRGMLATYRGDLPGGLAFSRQALEFIPASSLFHNLAVRALSALLLMTGELDEAARLVEAEVSLSRQAGDRLSAVVTLRRMGTVYLFRGALSQARMFYQRSLEASRDEHGELWPIAGIALQHLAELALEQNDLPQAERYLLDGLALLEGFIPIWSVASYLALTRLRLAQSNAEGARRAVERAEALARDSDTPLDDVQVALFQVRLKLRQGDLEPARRWAAEQKARPVGSAVQRDLEQLVSLSYLLQAEQLLLARLDLAEGEAGRALERLEALPAAAGRRTTLTGQIEGSLLRAHACHHLGRLESARASLTEALRLAEPEGYIRLFLEEGEWLRHLLAEFRPRMASAALAEFTDRVLQAAASAAAAPSTPAGALNERETQILRLIAEGLSNQAIAARLYLSVPTVKWHAGHLYAKLGVQSRTQAIARGRELGLLTPA